MQNSKIAKLKAQRAKQHRLTEQKRHVDSLDAVNELKDHIKTLYESINGQQKLDIDKLSQQIEDLSKIIDIKDQVKEIAKAIKQIKPEVHTKSVDLAPIVEAIEKNKPDYDFSRFENAIIQIQQRVQEQSEEDSQLAEDYKPFRRVVKVGNRLVFDDQPTPSRGGGGSSGSSAVSNFPSDYPLPTSQVTTLTPPAAITGFATSAKQDIIIGHLDGVEGVLSLPSTPTVSTVDDSASSVTIIAANSSRKEIEFQNTSSGSLFLRKGTSAATTASGGYSVKIPQDGYYTTNYTGAFRGIWDADVGGAVTITETT